MFFHDPTWQMASLRQCSPNIRSGRQGCQCHRSWALAESVVTSLKNRCFSTLRRTFITNAFLPAETEESLDARQVEEVEDFVSQCDVVTVNALLHKGDLWNVQPAPKDHI
ncbi:formate dehydrogenase [Moniliophthora roreri]|nr:formate dehydrogenase [Moniliophthora roreri]